MSQTPSADMCFACGRSNPIGLGLQFKRTTGGKVFARFSPTEYHQGWDGIVHGGLLATLMDEAMAHSITMNGDSAVTAKMEIRYKQPVPVGQTLEVIGWIVSDKGRLVETKAFVILSDGKVAAEAMGTFMKIDTK
jgi:uncharacterized protein (TIGR00369 family)